MEKKLLTILLTLVMVLSTFTIIPNDMKMENVAGSKFVSSLTLDVDYIKEITENLSNIIFNATIYPPGAIAKGRAFGTLGERAAKDYLFDEMDELGLNPIEEKIEDIDSGFDLAGIELNNHLEVLEQKIKVYNNLDQTEEELEYFGILPRWNESWKWNFPLLKQYDATKLTHIFNYTGLEVKQRNYLIRDWIDDCLFVCIDIIEDLISSGALNNFTSIIKYLFSLLEDYYDFSFEDLEENPENITSLSWYPAYSNVIGNSEDFVFIGENPAFNPNAKIPKWQEHLESIDNVTRPVIHALNAGREIVQTVLWNCTNYPENLPDCLGLMLFDFKDNVFDSNYFPYNALPYMYINKSIGTEINNSVCDFTIDLYLNQHWNTSVNSSNVIGQINGINPDSNKTVIIGCLYDSWWCQGTADAAIGMGMVMGLAKYMKQLETEFGIIPKYNVKFIAFSGEEHRGRGVFYHEANNGPDVEDVVTFVDLNQLGFAQPAGDPRLTLYITSDNKTVNSTTAVIGDDANYVGRTGDTADFKTQYSSRWHFGNYYPYTDEDWDISRYDRSACNYLFFVKDTAWTLHHRGGKNHEYGDVMTYYDSDDVNVTTEIIWNVTKFYAINPDCWFSNVSYDAFDSDNDGDDLIDSIKANFTIKSVLPQDLTRVDVILTQYTNGGYGVQSTIDSIDCTVNSGSVNGSYVYTISDDAVSGNYSLSLRVYNSTGRINEIVGLGSSNFNDTSESSDKYMLYHPFGYTKIGLFSQNIDDKICGSVFTTNEYGIADNITAFIGTAILPVDFKFMIYRKSDMKLIGVTDEAEDITMMQPQWFSLPFSEPKPMLYAGTEYVLVGWSDGSTFLRFRPWDSERGRYNDTLTYGDPPEYINFTNNSRLYSIFCSYTADITSPEISNVYAIPDVEGFGQNFTIYAEVNDSESGVGKVKVDISYPSSIKQESNFTMEYIGDDIYAFNFSDTWEVGRYNYTVWAEDCSVDGNLNSSSGFSFNVSASATVNVTTLKDSYRNNEYINLTSSNLTIYSSLDDGHIVKSGTTYNAARNAPSGTVSDSFTSMKVGQQYKDQGGKPYYIWRQFLFFNTSAIPSNAVIDTATLQLYGEEDCSDTDFDIVIQNGQPNYPHMPLQSGDYDKDYYEGNGGSFKTESFQIGYNDLSLTNLSWINLEGWTKLCLRSSRDINGDSPSGDEYVEIRSMNYPGTNGPRLVIECLNQSKIKNIGTTNFSGYLLMEVQYHSQSDPPVWIVDYEAINETFPRTINISDQLPLDLLFNGLVNTNDLSCGDGTYRVYAAFRDPEGNVLVCDDELELAAWYEFQVTYS